MRYPNLLNSARTLTCLLAAVLFLVAPLGVGAQTAVALASHTPLKVLNGQATRVSHYSPEQKLRLALAIQPPHMAEEEEFIKELTTKGSPNFHKFLSADEWNARFAPSAEDEQKVVDWATSVGFTVTKRYPNRLLVDVEAPSGVIENVLGVTLNNYQVGDEVDFSNDRDPMLPGDVAGIVHAILGLNNVERVHRAGSRHPTPKGPDYIAGPAEVAGPSIHGDGDPTKAPWNRAASKVSGSTPSDSYPLRQIGSTYAANPSNIQSSEGYDYNALQALSHCCNEPGASGGSPPESSIALVGLGDFNYSDVETFFSYYGMAYSINSYYINGSGYPPVDDEAPLDVEYSGAMSNSYGSYQDTAHIFEYELANTEYVTFADTYNDILNDNLAKVVSTSYGWEENVGFSGTEATGTMHPIYDNMVGEGWTLIASSGDSGATAGCGDLTVPLYPATDPDFIAAGGTQLDMYTDGTFYSETAWQGENWTGACSSNHGGSTGGVSVLFGAPWWQNSGLTSTTYPNGVVSPFYLWKNGGEYIETGNGNRMVPDISLTANPDVMGEWYYSGGSWQSEGGTSIVAPELAGFFAQENSYLDYIGYRCGNSGTYPCSPVGQASPFIYEDAIAGAPHNPFYDMTSGCSDNDVTAADDLFYYCAYSGYDPITGWGSVNMLQLAWGINWELIPAYGQPSVHFSGPATSAWYNTNQTVSWSVSDAGSPQPPGVAGFTQGWDTIPDDPTTEPHGGSGNSFYSGPQFPFATGGCLSFTGGGCAGNGGAQGCHTARVEAWDNQGRNVISYYGPICYDTVAPTITMSTNPLTSGTVWVDSPVKVTLTATDPGGGNSSGIYKTYFAINSTSCSPSNIGACQVYSGPFTISTPGQSYVYYWTKDNAGNVSTETYQWVSIEAPAALTSPVVNTTLTGPKVTFTWSAGTHATDYALRLGTTVGGNNLYGSGVITGTSVMVPNLPLNGEQIYARLYTYFGSTQVYTDYTFTAAKQSSLTAPAPSTTLAGPKVTFTWSGGGGATDYALRLGTTPGGNDIYVTGVTTATSATPSNLPLNGETIHARLYTYFGSTQVYTDYTFTAATQSALTSPAANTTLTGPKMTFTWSAGKEATAYALRLGTTPGGTNVYVTGETTATSATPSNLPLNGETIHARLYTYFGSSLVYTDYTFIAATQSAMTLPAPGTTLTGSKVTFTWTAGTEATAYALRLGTTPGGTDVYVTGVTTATTATPTHLPTNGEKIYARLYTYFGSTQVYTDYTYTAYTAP